MTDAGRSRLLVARAGELAVAFPLREVALVLRPLPCTPLPDVPSFVRGMAVVRGDAIPVVDLGELLAGRPSVTVERWVVVKAGTRRVAVAVHSVAGVRELSTDRFSDLPPLCRDAPAALARVTRLDGELAAILETARLLPEALAGGESR